MKKISSSLLSIASLFSANYNPCLAIKFRAPYSPAGKNLQNIVPHKQSDIFRRKKAPSSKQRSQPEKQAITAFLSFFFYLNRQNNSKIHIWNKKT